MPTPTLTTSKPVTTHVHEVTTRKPDYLDLLTVLLPLLTFAAGYYLNSLVENRKEKKRLRQVEEYFIALVAALGNAIDVQTEAIQDAISRIQVMSDDSLAAGLVPELRTTRIKAIPDLDLYKIFIANRPNISANTQLLNNVSSALDFIDEVKTRIEQMNIDVTKLTADYINQYNIDSNAIAEQNREFAMQSPFRIENSEAEFKKLNIIYAQQVKAYATKALSRDITSAYNNFIKPLYEASRVIKENNSTYQMLYLIVKQNNDYKNFISSKEVGIEMFSSLTLQLKSIRTDLASIVDSLSNKL